MSIRRKRWLVTALVVLLLSCAVTLTLLNLARQPFLSQEELCEAVSEYIDWTACLAQSGITNIVHEAFPPGVTTRDDVRRAIGAYLDVSLSDDGPDYYRLDDTWLIRNLGFQEAYYVFIYDKNDRLLNIWYLD